MSKKIVNNIYTTNNNDTASIGLFVYQNDNSGLSGITSLTFNHTTNREGFDIEICPDLTTINFPYLETITEGGYFQVSDCPLLTTFIASNLVSAGQGFSCYNLPAITTMSFPNFATASQGVSTANNTSLTTLTVSSSFRIDDTYSINITGCSLNQTSVDNFLKALVSGSSLSCSFDSRGGLNATTSSIGSASAAILRGRGWTVLTN